MKTIQVEPEQMSLIKSILIKNIPDCDVFAFGSRTTGRAKPHSDLDLCIKGKDELSLNQLAILREAFTESNLPFRVDLIDWNNIQPLFKAAIEKEWLQLQST